MTTIAATRPLASFYFRNHRLLLLHPFIQKLGMRRFWCTWQIFTFVFEKVIVLDGKDGCTIFLEAIIQKRFLECLQFGQHQYSKTQIGKPQLAVSHSRLRHIFQITWGYTKGSVQSIIKNLPPDEWWNSIQADQLQKLWIIWVLLQQGVKSICKRSQTLIWPCYFTALDCF